MQILSLIDCSPVTGHSGIVLVAALTSQWLMPDNPHGRPVLSVAKGGIPGQVGAQRKRVTPLPAPADSQAPGIMIVDQVGVLGQWQCGSAGNMVVEHQLLGT